MQFIKKQGNEMHKWVTALEIFLVYCCMDTREPDDADCFPFFVFVFLMFFLYTLHWYGKLPRQKGTEEDMQKFASFSILPPTPVKEKK
jgi:hypothetical protein